MPRDTKADAQNVSFAIPTREFTRLNVSKRPMNWVQLAATDRPAPTNSLMQSRSYTDEALEAEAAAGSFAVFQQRLKDSVGKSVTVVVQEAGRTNIFTFTVK